MATFTDKVIVITGASEGIGRALCLALAPQRPRLAIAARNEERLNELMKEVESKGAQALIVPTDVTCEEACKRLIRMTIEKWGSIDVLVNNAGGTMWTKFEDITDTSIFEKLIRLNYLGSVYCTYYALHYLKKSQGLVVAVSSVAGLVGVPTRTGYAASKHALFGFFDSLRIELEGTGVSVTMVAPAFVLSEIHRRALGHDGKPLGKSPLQEDSQILPGLRNNRVQRHLIDVQLKHIRPAVMADDVKVELRAADLAEIKRRRQNGFTLKIGPREYLAQRANDCTAAAHQHRIRRIAERHTHGVREILFADELACRQYETAPFQGDVLHRRQPSVPIVSGRSTVQCDVF